MVTAAALSQPAYRSLPVHRMQMREMPLLPYEKLEAAVTDFYEGLNKLHEAIANGNHGQSEDVAEDHPTNGLLGGKFELEGWEVGYLDEWYTKKKAAQAAQLQLGTITAIKRSVTESESVIIGYPLLLFEDVSLPIEIV
ncbi:hypothetical protein HKX48_001932 [Thoreauomyces humboldtii]|nr:hypothetical protein HKX48_001932 [Thoreauomyces humboldtii]